MSPQAQSQARRENIAAFRRAHPRLSVKQNAVLDRASNAAANPDMFVSSSGLADRLVQSGFDDDVKREFTPEDSWFVLSLGTERSPSGVSSDCQCATQSDYCSNYCRSGLGCT
ncbi:bacteriocin fulvocin C-related protein [Amycolatopsis sp. NPDC004378]